LTIFTARAPECLLRALRWKAVKVRARAAIGGVRADAVHARLRSACVINSAVAGRHDHEEAAAMSAPRTARRYVDDALMRATDIVIAIVMLVCAAPVLLGVAIAIRLESPGPSLFRQRRIGRGGVMFTVFKFRSMSVEADPEVHRAYVARLAAEGGPDNGTMRKLTGDRRVTRVGAIIRKTSLDEWPQLFNVLAGTMSIVGPRPAVEYELDLYSPVHFDRFRVRPGLTGLWQVSGRSRLGFVEMLDLDVEYVRSRNLASNLRIMARTPRALLEAQTA